MPPTQDEIDAARGRLLYDKDFMPDRKAVALDMRSTAALEYIAHQMGVMRHDISAIRAALERLAKP